MTRRVEPLLNSLWIGPRLSPIHLACLLSAVRAGHKVRLFCYSPPENLPAEIETANAEEVLPQTEIMRHRNSGSPSLSSNRFRYLLFDRELGPWIDTDVFVLKPLTSRNGYMMAWQDDELIGSAVLQLPRGKLTDSLCDFTAQSHPIPFWYPRMHRCWLRARQAVGFPLAAGDYRWGIYGPHLLTNSVRLHKLEGSAEAPGRYYPVTWRDAGSLYRAEGNVLDTLPETTEAVHLWHHMGTNAPDSSTAIEAGSFLDQAFRMVDMKPHKS
ncbi:MAG: hypothetical protein AAGA00_00230 [Pseudomonadota bacterium]